MVIRFVEMVRNLLLIFGHVVLTLTWFNHFIIFL